VVDRRDGNVGDAGRALAMEIKSDNPAVMRDDPTDYLVTV
jgi:hypothetical protein